MITQACVLFLTPLSLCAIAALAQEAPMPWSSASPGRSRIHPRDKDLQSGNQGQGQGAHRKQAGASFRFHAHDGLAMGATAQRDARAAKSSSPTSFRTLLVRTYSGALSNYRDTRSTTSR